MRSWRSWPPRAWALLGALVAFSVIVLGVLYWAQFTGRAGASRGVVISNELNSDLVVDVVVGVGREDVPAGDYRVFKVKREQFPTDIVWSKSGTDIHDAERLEYRYVADAGFRISIDEEGIHPTATYRDTPVPATETP